MKASRLLNLEFQKANKKKDFSATEYFRSTQFPKIRKYKIIYLTPWVNS